MTWLALAWRWLSGGLSALLDLGRRYPWQCAVVSLLALFLWTLHGKHHAEAQRDRWHRIHDLRVEAERLAAQAQKALNAKTQQTYKDQADAAQERYDASRDRVRDATDRYILARRVQPNQCAAGGGDPAPAAGGSGLPAPVPSAVVVDQSDVRACADLYAYSLSAHEWAKALIDAGVAR